MRASSTRRTLLAALLVGCSACSAAAVVSAPRSFDRPGHSSLVCFDVTASPPVAVPLARCAPTDPTAGTLPVGLDLHALVLQSRRGEIAVVDLRTNTILDTNQTIPGYTFVEAGALPVDIVSSSGRTAGSPITTYVANSGTEDIWVFATDKFRARATGGRQESQKVPLGPDSAPSAIALTPDERFLIVALPTLGKLRQFPVLPTGLLGDALTPDIDLATVVLDPLTAEPEVPLYHRECSTAALELPTAAPARTARSAGTEAYPVVLLVDEESGQLLVGDSALPLVHRFAIDASGIGAEGPALAIGTPVRDLALTPRVPSEVNSTVADRRYLYALDDTGAVAVLDYSDLVAFPNGRPISIEIPTARQQDRITFAAPATALTIVATREYDPAAPKPFCVPPESTAPGGNGPTRLHGVFLVASLTDGTVRFVDVYDRDAACRGNAGLCAGTTTSVTNDSVVYIRRHRPRVGLFVASELGVLGSPTMSGHGVPYAIDNDGQPASASVPALDVLGDCAGVAPSFIKAFPRTDAAPLICALGDPWAATQERWTATYEGTILSGVAGRFGTPGFVAGETNFCRAGVLGTMGAGAAPGDQLVITGDLPPRKVVEMPDCARLVQVDVSTGARPPIAFAIDDADDDGNLVIGDTTLGASAETRGFVAGCFDELVTFEVRARESWVVRGSFSGLLRPAPAARGACVASLDPAGLGFRAYSGTPFVSRALAFRIALDPLVPTAAGTVLSFDTGGLPASLGVDLTPGSVSGSIPVDLFYSSVENNLYAVDAGRAALSRITVENVRVDRLFQ